MALECRFVCLLLETSTAFCLHSAPSYFSRTIDQLHTSTCVLPTQSKVEKINITENISSSLSLSTLWHIIPITGLHPQMVGVDDDFSVCSQHKVAALLVLSTS